MDTQIQGTVKFFNEEKGFGFIKHDNSSKETFVHANGLIDQIEANDKVFHPNTHMFTQIFKIK